jgi:hypothetical protein
VLEELVHGDDARVAHRAGEPRLLHEAFGKARIGEVLGQQLLERDVSAQVALIGEVHDRRPSAADHLEHVVPTNLALGLDHPLPG